jgi:O-antigen ligase
MKQDIVYKYFFLLFSLIPISILFGSAVSAVNIMLISVSFFIYLIYLKEWNWLKNYQVQLLIIFYIYLIFNSFISIELENGLVRNFGFIRFIFFFVAFNYFFYKYKNFPKFLWVWFFVILIVVADVYLESITGKNILGYGNGDRIVSFFKDEQIVGGFISCFYLIVIGYLLNFHKFKSIKLNYLFLFLASIFLFSIILSGERSSSIRAVAAFIFFFSFARTFSIKEKIILFLSISILFVAIFANSEFVKLRYGKQLLRVMNLESFNQIIKYYTDDEAKFDDEFSMALGASYFRIYKSGIEVFKDYPLFGVGNKNYRIVTCPDTWPDEWNDDYLCTTHPHQIYIEFLSEHGILGTTIILLIFSILIFKMLKQTNIRENNLQLACLLYIIFIFSPLIPSGSFFSNHPSTLFWVNFSLMFAANRRINIFNRSN